MSNDSYTEVTTTSYGKRIGNSFKGIITGIVLIILGTCLLYWNEGRSVRQAGAIAEAELITVDLPNISTIDPSFNNKVVYAKGEAKTTDLLSDIEIGVSTTAINLNREVYYYQWVENESTETVKKVGGSEEKRTTYTYELQWTSDPINSANFKVPEGHENKVIFKLPLETKEFEAKNVSFGAYKLPSFLIRGISNPEDLALELTPRQLEHINSNLVPLPNSIQVPITGENTVNTTPNVQYNTPYTTNMNTNTAQQQVLTQPMAPVQAPIQRVHVNANSIYLGENQASPQVGDIKISYTQTKDTNISIVAEVDGNTFSHYVASNGNTFSYLSNKEATKEVIFQSAKDSNSIMTWIIRIFGIFIVVIGFKAILAPLSVLADVIPLLGDLVGIGTGLVGGLVGTAWSLIIIAFAWIRFRPMLAFALIGIALAFIVFTIWKGKSKKSAENPTAG